MTAPTIYRRGAGNWCEIAASPPAIELHDKLRAIGATELQEVLVVAGVGTADGLVRAYRRASTALAANRRAAILASRVFPACDWRLTRCCTETLFGVLAELRNGLSIRSTPSLSAPAGSGGGREGRS